MEINSSVIEVLKPISESLSHFLNGKNYSKIALLLDENTRKYCYPKISELLPSHSIIEIQSGEEYKNLKNCEFIWQKMTDFEMDRKSLLINLGGGVIGDMGGFCAATFKRGIDFILIPTTLLSMVDASVGGKLGIDFQGFKNHIGVFKEPEKVLIDAVFLETLTQKEYLSGFAEIIKHCLITDKGMFQSIAHSSQSNDYRPSTIDYQPSTIDLIQHSIAIKTKIVEADPFEKGLRKILNFGHTIGHAIETFYLEKPEKKLLHGEAIAVGMICESYISYQRKMLSAEELEMIVGFIRQIYPKILVREDELDLITKLTLQDKKNRSNQVLFTLLKGIGAAVFDEVVSMEEMKESLSYYKKNE